MNVLHCSQYYWPVIGGAEKYCQDISEGLAKNPNFKISLYTTDTISVNPIMHSSLRSEIRKNVEIKRLRALPILSGLYGNKDLDGRVSSAIRLFNLSDQENTWPYAFLLRSLTSSVSNHFPEIVKKAKESDVVALFNIITGMTSMSFLAAKLAKRPTAIFPMFHFGLLSYERPSMKRILSNVGAVICSTDYERNEMVKRGVDPSRAFTVYEAVAEPTIDRKGGDQFREKLGLKEGDFVVVYIGRRDFDKGYTHVLEAVSQLVEAREDVKLIVSGFGERGADFDSYKLMERNHALFDLGVCDDKQKLEVLSAADVVVLPSRAETYPLVFVESWFLGKPVIGAKIGSVASVVREGIDGFLVDFGNVRDLAFRIRTLCHNRNLCEQIGNNGLEKAKVSFRIEEALEQIKVIYESLAGSTSRARI